MGAEQSRQREEGHSKLADIPIQFSQDVVNQLADAAMGPEPSPARQVAIDARIQERILAEVARLRDEELQVQTQIERALAKENLDHDTAHAVVSDNNVRIDEEITPLHSVVLLGDLEEVRQKVDKFHFRENGVSQQATGAALTALNCYRNQSTRPLDCWREVSAFQQAVDDMEQVSRASFVSR